MTPSNERTTKAAFWQQHIVQWKDTEQTQIAYCREHALHIHQFSYWLHKGEPVSTQKTKSITAASSAATTSAFVPVVKHQPSLPHLSLSLPNGMLLQGIDSDNLATVKQLLGLLS